MSSLFHAHQNKGELRRSDENNAKKILKIVCETK